MAAEKKVFDESSDEESEKREWEKAKIWYRELFKDHKANLFCCSICKEIPKVPYFSISPDETDSFCETHADLTKTKISNLAKNMIDKCVISCPNNLNNLMDKEGKNEQKIETKNGCNWNGLIMDVYNHNQNCPLVLKKHIDPVNKKIKDLRKKIKKINELNNIQIGELNKNMDSLTQNQNFLQEKNGNLTKEINVLKDSMNQLLQKFDLLKKEIVETKVEKNKLRSELNLLKDEKTKQNAKCISLRKNVNLLKKSVENDADAIKRLLKYLNENVNNDILQDNISFERDRQIFNLQYFKFLFDIFRVAPTPEYKEYSLNVKINEKNIGLNVIKQATFVCFKFLARTSNKNIIFSKFVAYLKYLYQNNIEACVWLLEYLSTNKSNVADYIMVTRDPLVMHGFSELLIHVLKTLKPFEEKKLMEQKEIIKIIENDKEEEKKEIKIKESIVSSSKIMDIMIELIEIAPKYWFRFEYFFKVFLEYSKLGYYQREYLIKKNLITILGDFYLGPRSPYKLNNNNNKQQQIQQMGSRLVPPKFEPIIQILSILIISCNTAATQRRYKTKIQIEENLKELEIQYNNNNNNSELEEKIKNAKIFINKLKILPNTALILYENNKNIDLNDIKLIEFSENDNKLLLTRAFYDKMVESSHNSKNILNSLINIVCHWSFEDIKYSHDVCGIICEGVDQSGTEQVKTFFIIMEKFMLINDNHTKERLDRLHLSDKSVLHYIELFRNEHSQFSFAAIKSIVELMQRQSIYLKYMLSIRQHWIWYDQFLDSFCHRKYYYNQSNESSQAKENFFKSYQKLLLENGIECQRIPQQQQQQPSHHHHHHHHHHQHHNQSHNSNDSIEFEYPNAQQPIQQATVFPNHFDATNNTNNVNNSAVPGNNVAPDQPLTVPEEEEDNNGTEDDDGSLDAQLYGYNNSQENNIHNPNNIPQQPLVINQSQNQQSIDDSQTNDGDDEQNIHQPV